MKQSALSLILSAFFLSPRFLLFAHGGESSTSSSNYCSSLVPGDLYFYMVQSQIPNQIGIVGFADMPGGLEIFLTDNAWTGESFQTNEGTLKLTIPESGIEQGRAFGYGSNIYLGDQWETTESNFWLHHEKGDALFLYCKSEGIVNVLSALSTSGGFEPSGWEFYLEHQSALPDALEGNYGVVVLQDHLDSYIYNGPSYIRNDDYQKALMNPENWMGEEYKPSPSPPPSLFPTATLPASSATANTAINSGTMVAMTILRFFF